MEMYHSTEGEQNPNAVFHGLGLVGWLKLIFRTRAGTLKQSDKLTDDLFDKLNAACGQAKQAQEAAQLFAKLVIKQNDALVLAEVQLRDDDSFGEERIAAHTAVVEAIEAAKDNL